MASDQETASPGGAGRSLSRSAVDFNYAALIHVSGRRGWEGQAGTVLPSFQRAGNLLTGDTAPQGEADGYRVETGGLRLQPVHLLWFLVRQMRPEQDQGSGDGGRTAASGTGDRPWTLVSAGPAGGMQAGGPSLSPPSADRCRGQGCLCTPPSTSLPFVARPALTLHMHPGSRHLAGVLPTPIPLTQARGSAPCVDSPLWDPAQQEWGGTEQGPPARRGWRAVRRPLTTPWVKSRRTHEPP